MAFGGGSVRKLIVRLEADVSEATGTLNKIDGQLGGFKSAMKTAGGAIAAGFALDKIVDFGKATLDVASSTQENMNKVATVFGTSADKVTKFILEADKIGLSDKAASDYLGTLGNMFNQLGFTSGAAADMSTGMATLAADLGSFNNIPTGDVLEAMNAGFRGEYDSLQRVIPTINAAAVNQKAMADTGETSADQLTAQEKAAATYKLMIEGAGEAQGDFKKTQAGAANQSKIMAARMEDLQGSIGEKLLPVVETLGNFLLNDLIPAFEAVWNAMTPIAEWIADNLDLFEALAIGLGVVGVVILASMVPAFIAWAVAAGAAAVATLAAAAPFIAIGAAVAAVAYLIIRNWDTIKDVTEKVWNFVLGIIQGVWDWVAKNWPLLLAIIAGPIGIAAKLVIDHWDSIKSAVSSAWSWIVNLMSSIGSIIAAPFTWAWGVISNVWGWIQIAAQAAYNFMVNVFNGLAAAITNPIKTAWNALASLWNSTVGAINIKIPDWVPGLGGKGFDVPDLPHLAKGGIVTGPTIALLGEAGPEKVIPLGRDTTSRPVVINVQAGVGDPVEIGRQVAAYMAAFENVAGPQYARPV